MSSYNRSTPGHTSEYVTCDPEPDGFDNFASTGTNNTTPAAFGDALNDNPFDESPNRTCHPFDLFTNSPDDASVTTELSIACHVPEASWKFTSSSANTAVREPSLFRYTVDRAARLATVDVDTSNADFPTDPDSRAASPDTPAATGNRVSADNPPNATVFDP